MPPSNLLNLDGLRALASFWVFAGHLLFMPPYDVGFAKAVKLTGASIILEFNFIAADIFLLLSGFLIYRSHRYDFDIKPARKAIDRFYLNRLLRMYPLHVFTLGVMWLIHINGIPHPIFSGNQDIIFNYWPLTLSLNLALMQSWGFVPVASWNEPAWTISALMFMYLIFPTWVMLPKRLSSTASNILAMIGMAVVLELSIHWIDGISMSDGIGSLIRTFTLFMTGCFAYNLYERYRPLPGWHGDAAFLFCAAWLLGGILFFVYVKDFPLILLRLSYPLLLLTLVWNTHRISAFFSSRIMVYLGKLSYSLYLTHYPALLLIRYIGRDYFPTLATSAPQWLLWLHYAAITLLAFLIAVMCYYAIERPCQRWVKRYIAY